MPEMQKEGFSFAIVEISPPPKVLRAVKYFRCVAFFEPVHKS